MAAGGCIDDEFEAAGFQQIDSIGPALVHFENRFAREAGGFQRLGSPASGEKQEAEFVEFSSDFNSGGFIAIVDTDEERPGIGNGRSRGELRFAERFAETLTDAHDFAG